MKIEIDYTTPISQDNYLDYISPNEFEKRYNLESSEN